MLTQTRGKNFARVTSVRQERLVSCLSGQMGSIEAQNCLDYGIMAGTPFLTSEALKAPRHVGRQQPLPISTEPLEAAERPAQMACGH